MTSRPIDVSPSVDLTKRSALRRVPMRFSFVGKVPLVPAICITWLIVISLCAIFAPLVAPHDPVQQNLLARNLPPFWDTHGSWDHALGTNATGQDVLSRVIWGARPALLIGASGVIFSMVLGTGLGLISGFYRGRSDALIMALADAQLSMPFLVIALAVVAVLGQGTGILILLAGFGNWMGFSREIRSLTVSLRRRDFVVASQAMGAKSNHLIVKHLLPNVAPIILVLVTNSIAGMILFEASMGFLGMGVPAPQPSWGSMISDGRNYILSHWWLSVAPGVALMVTVVACSLIGDWLRDLIDPTLRR